MRVLVVDDDRGARALLHGVLTKLGHEVLDAADGPEAVRIIEQQQVRLLVTDWNMPAMSGVDLCRHVRERGGPYIYTILVTVRNDLDSFSQGMAAGADDFITKPIDVALLAARVRVADRILGLMKEVTSLQAKQLPMCIYCHRLQDEAGEWVSTEEYVMQQAAVDVAERVCPECYETHIKPELEGLEDL